MFKGFSLPTVKLPECTKKLRDEVRNFIDEELQAGTFTPHCDSWLAGFSPEFSRKLGEKGWIGVTWPRKYGGQERSALDRFVITEELLAAGAPVAAHWIADRQSGPLLLRYGTEEQRTFFLPKIARGECYFSIGLSEPNSGSDLASISTSARREGDGWVINGSKIWTSGAHKTQYMIALCRTSRDPDNRHAGMSQFIIDLSLPGVIVRPIILMTGEHHFNEVIFEDVKVSDDMVVGEIGNGWKQSMTELAYERSGPERFLSTFPLLVELVRILRKNGQNDKHSRIEIGRLVAHLWTLRRMSLGVAKLLEEGITPNIPASLVKDLGTQFERELTEKVRLLVSLSPSMTSIKHFEVLLAQAILHSPGFTLRGGTTEILRGIIARGLGVR